MWYKISSLSECFIIFTWLLIANFPCSNLKLRCWYAETYLVANWTLAQSVPQNPDFLQLFISRALANTEPNVRTIFHASSVKISFSTDVSASTAPQGMDGTLDRLRTSVICSFFPVFDCLAFFAKPIHQFLQFYGRTLFRERVGFSDNSYVMSPVKKRFLTKNSKCK